MQALIGETVVAETADDQLVQIEGNQYFPPDSVMWEFFEDSSTPYTCPWKGQAQYWNARTGAGAHADVAWCYPTLKQSAVSRVGVDFSGYVAFNRVQVRLVGSRPNMEML